MDSETAVRAEPDLTRIKDPAAIWPDPEDCPDWPLYTPGFPAGDAGNREDAEARLNALIRSLHGEADLRAPKKEEVEDALSEHFKKSSAGGFRLEQAGFPGLDSRRNAGEAIAEAVHIRGYLRKLDTRVERWNREAKDAEERRHRQAIDTYPERAERLKDELESLAEAVARHRQRLEDEQAVSRVAEIRHQLTTLHMQASQAAQQLGEEPPERRDAD